MLRRLGAESFGRREGVRGWEKLPVQGRFRHHHRHRRTRLAGAALAPGDTHPPGSPSALEQAESSSVLASHGAAPEP